MIITAGELLVEFMSQQKDCALKASSNFLGPYPSGAPAIFIEQAAKVGAKTQILGSVGDDSFGQLLLDRLKQQNVDVSAINTNSGKPTGVAFVSYFSDGNRIFAFYIENTAAQSWPLIEIKEKNTLLHISGASINQATEKRYSGLIKAVLEKNGKLCCDPNIRPELLETPQALEQLKWIVENSYILLPSEADIEYLYPDCSESQAIEKLLDLGVELIVLKRGAKGIVMYSKNNRVEIAGHAVEEIDPTGAGDCFCGAFLGLIDQGWDTTKAARYANAAAALHVTKIGPMEFNPSLQEIDDFLSH